MSVYPEQSITLEEVGERVEQAYVRGKTHAIIVNGEGSEHKSHEIATFLNDQGTGFDVRVTILGHVQRGGRPSGFDRLLATRMGVKAVELLRDGQSGLMTSISGRKMEGIPLEQAVSQIRPISDGYFEMAHFLSR